MTVKELRDALEKLDDGLDVMIEVYGNLGYGYDVRKDSYRFFGQDIPCIIVSDEKSEEEE